jgi:hypothetical protein
VIANPFGSSHNEIPRPLTTKPGPARRRRPATDNTGDLQGFSVHAEIQLVILK